MTTGQRASTFDRGTATISDAKGMVITRVEPVLLSSPYPPDQPLTWSGGVLPGVTAALVRIRTNDGLTGVGETYAGNFAPEVVRAHVDYFADYLVGQDPSDIAGLWDRCWTRILYWGRAGLPVSVLSAVESALWDLCGKAVGKPVHALLGSAHDRLPRYASGGMGESSDALRTEQAEFRLSDYRASKIRTGFNPQVDFERARAALDSVESGVQVAVDAVQGSNPNAWTGQQAIETGRALEPLGLLWYEEPCSALDLAGYRACREALDIPIAGGETLTTVPQFATFLDADPVDVLQPDAALCGGILTMREITALCESRDVAVAVHAWGSGGSVMSNYHAAFASPAARWLEYPTQPNPLITELLVEPLKVVDGYVLAPTAPGLGLALTPELEERYPFRPDCHYYFEERRSGGAQSAD